MCWPHLSSTASRRAEYIYHSIGKNHSWLVPFSLLCWRISCSALCFLWVVMFYLFVCSLICRTVFDLLPRSRHHSREQWASCSSCPQVAQELCGRCRPVKTQCTGTRARRWANQGSLRGGRDIYLLYLTVTFVTSNIISSLCLIRRQNGQHWDVSWRWKSELEGSTPQDIYSSAASITLPLSPL